MSPVPRGDGLKSEDVEGALIDGVKAVFCLERELEYGSRDWSRAKKNSMINYTPWSYTSV